MAENPDPAVIRRRLRIELRQLRTESGASQQQVARALGWEPTKLAAIEYGITGISTADLRSLLDAYHVEDLDRVRRLVGEANDSRRLATAGYRSVPFSTIRFWNLRRAAARVRQLEPLLIPGLLQTEEYAREVVKAYASPALSAADISERVIARIDQQSLLERDDCPELHFLIDEAALRRLVGGPEVMRRQLEALKEHVEHTGLTIQILSFGLGAHPGICGPFQILEYRDEDPVLYLDDAAGGKTTRDMETETLQYLAVFWHLEEVATAPGDTSVILDRIIAELPTS
ncbi:helix-turn-helix transcriptional regulator [Actinoplanes sp. NPDC049118]|uniref:helix-turn-helix domain-containing protein n=1 Tax=Actinoplanes sp. NPDC049118 TaxID=3155769 RepID=UPI0033F83DC3